jgi:hypothetical protein
MSVVLERDGEPVRGRPRETGACHEPGQGGRPGLQGRENKGGFVENADSARVVHTLIMPSRMLESKPDFGQE